MRRAANDKPLSTDGRTGGRAVLCRQRRTSVNQPADCRTTNGRRHRLTDCLPACPARRGAALRGLARLSVCLVAKHTTRTRLVSSRRRVRRHDTTVTLSCIIASRRPHDYRRSLRCSSLFIPGIFAFLGGGFPSPQKTYSSSQTAVKFCLFFGRGNELQIYHGNILLMDS